MAVAKLPASALILILSSALSACGGGGSDSGSSSATSSAGNESTAQSVQVSGYAVKGVISQGIITAWGVEPDGSLERLGESVRTSANGFYDLNLSTGSKLIKLELTSDLSTRMRCDAVDGCQDYGTSTTVEFGDDFWPGPDLQLETMVSLSVSAKQSQGHLTPLTTLSTTLFEAKGAESGWEGFQNAQRRVEGWFGLQQGAIGLTPVDITTSLQTDMDQAELEAALMNSAFLGLAAEFPEAGVQGVIEAFRQQLLNGGAINSNDNGEQPGSDRVQQYAALHAYTLADEEGSVAASFLASAGDRFSKGLSVPDGVGAQPDPSPNDETGNNSPDYDSGSEPESGEQIGQSPGTDPATGGPTQGSDQESATYAATLTWQAPRTRANGTALSMGEIDQYVVRYGTQPDAETMTSEMVVDGQAMEAQVAGLTEGTWYFAMRTVDQNGLESAWSEVASKTITQ